MKLYISKEFNQKFPEVNCAVVKVSGVKVTQDEVLREGDYKHKDKFEEHQLIKAFQEFYKDLRLGDKAGYPAVENLYRRFCKDGYVPKINNVVDANNKVSIETLVPGGVFDADQIKGDMYLRFSDEGEEYRPLGGGMEYLSAGEAVISDEEKILNLFPYRDSIYPKVSLKTKNVVVLGDKVKGVKEDETKRAVEQVSELLKEKVGGRIGKLFFGEVKEFGKSAAKQNLKKKYSILTGITPSGGGETHIGNYFGMVKVFLEMAKKADKMYFFIADLHALSTVQDREQFQSNVENQVLSYLACGLDPERIVFYRQSDIPQHTELQNILNNITPLGLIKRCHAYKDKLQKGFDEEQVNMGLFSYPVLMAADILLYDPDYVPVGDDQKQHIEITRDIAERFNKVFGETFKLPDIYNVKETARLVGTDGKRKMSKSLGNYISVLEDEEVIKKQIMGCFTDPNRKKATDPGRVEGNPIFSYHDLINEDKKEVEDLKKRYRAGTVGDVEVKEKLFEAFLKKFKDERKRYGELKKDPDKIKQILKDGAQVMRDLAVKKMMDVRDKIGITNKYSFYRY